MSRRTHFVIQFLLLVVWAFVLMADNARSVSSQSCNNPRYSYMNPLRNFWPANIGNVPVEMDETISSHYPSAPDAAARIEEGQRGWNSRGMCTTGFARKVVLLGFEVVSAVSAYLCYLCVKYSRDYSYAEITEIRRDHREDSESCKKHFSCKAGWS